MEQQLAEDILKGLLQATNINKLTYNEIVQLFHNELGMSDHLPDGRYTIDPRDGTPIVFNSNRRRRPHDNRPNGLTQEKQDRPCVICQGQSTHIVDVAELSEGVTFINKNMYPIFYPFDQDKAGNVKGKQIQEAGPAAHSAYGLHFLQWTSSYHDRDWHNMPLADAIIAMERLAALEKKLLEGSSELQATGPIDPNGPSEKYFVSIYKNYGYLVGGSLVHGHQQIAFTNVLPRRF